MSERIASLAEVQQFYVRGMTEYDKVILGETDAKTATLAAIANMSNVATFGVPGGGKTDLNEASHLIIEGISEEGVARIPTQADLKPERVVGAHVSIERKTNGVSEEITTDLDPLITAVSQKIEMDEVTRTNPHAVGATLEVIRRRRMVTTAGSIALRDLVYVGATLNPSENRQNTFVLADAFASRFPTGAVMGLRDPEVSSKIIAGFTPKPETISPFVTLDELRAINTYVCSDSVTSFPETLQPQGVAIARKMVDKLGSDFNFHESDNRLVRQLRENAITLAAFYGETAVTEQALRDAAKFIYMARLGLSGLRGTGMNVSDIDAATKEILG